MAIVDTASGETHAASHATGRAVGALGRAAPLAGLGAAALAATLGALLVQRRPLSALEATTAERAEGSLRAVLDWAITHDPAQAGYLALLHPIVSASTAEWALRGQSIAAAALACLAAYALGTVVAGRLAGGVAAFALALDAGAVAVSQQVRPLALSLLAILVATLALALALSRSDRWWLAYVPACVLLAASHPLAVSVLAAHGAAIAVAAMRGERSRVRAAVAFVVAATAAVPLALAALVDRAEDAGEAGLAVGELGRGLARAAGWSPVIALLAVLGCVALATGRAPKATPWKAALVAALVVAPVATVVLASLWLPAHPGWALVLAAPGLAVGAGVGVSALPGRTAVVGACCLLAAAAAPALVAWYAQEPAEDWRAASKRAAARVPGAVRLVVLPESGRAAFRYYAPRQPLASRAGGPETWVLIGAASPAEATQTARTVVPTPRYALLGQRRVADGFVLQRWVRP